MNFIFLLANALPFLTFFSFRYSFLHALLIIWFFYTICKIYFYENIISDSDKKLTYFR